MKFNQETSAGFIERHYGSLSLIVILIVLVIVHTVMIHWNRPPSVIAWVENLVTGVFTALIPILAHEDKKHAGNDDQEKP